MEYDLLIVGGGITGLYTGLKWLKQHPSSRCCIVEKYESLGGRVVTYRPTVRGKGKLQWESGAGRISVRHRRVLKLLKDYQLTFYPIHGDWKWNGVVESNPFEALSDLYLTPLMSLPTRLLRSMTLSDLLSRIHGPTRATRYMAMFPYYSEFHTLRADLALDALRGELRSGNGFGVCGEGLGELIHRMSSDFKKHGGEILTETTVSDIAYSSNPIQISMISKDKKMFCYAKRVVCAVQASAFSSIRSLSSLPFLRYLRMEPLLRIYAVFPTQQGRSWFSDLSTTVFNHPLRFFLPIRPDKGVAMISYTEGKDARHWFTMKDEEQKKCVMKALREVFPSFSIPQPLYYKAHLWREGCTYWLPGSYSAKEVSQQSIQPFSGIPLYLCNESFAVNQSWMESGLIQADQVLKKIL